MLTQKHLRNLLMKAYLQVSKRFNNIEFCSECFRDAGIAHTCSELGRKMQNACPRCGSSNVFGIRRDQLEELVLKFFVEGSYHHGLGGYAPVLMAAGPGTEHHDICLRADTLHDLQMIRAVSELNLKYNAPALWKLGWTEHWDVDDTGGEIEWKLTDEGVQGLIRSAPVRELMSGSVIYRVRLNLNDEVPIEDKAFDPPPENIERQFGRFDSQDFPLFYGGKSIDVCLHEIRLSNRDTITVATCKAMRTFRLLDITGDGCKGGPTPFEEPLHFFNGLVFSNNRIAECRFLAKKIKIAGFDGFIFKSYHSPIMFSPDVNVALFGWPIREKKLQVLSMNNVFLKQIRTEYQLGPLVR